MKATDISDPEYFHRVVDCQYACPAHTAVPEYIRLIAAGRYADAYMLNWESNVFPGILGRTCDRPCEPACRRGRLDDAQDAVAICRLKRVAADHKGEISHRLPPAQRPDQKNGHCIALIGAGPASLTVARDLLPLGYEIHIFDDQKAGGGMMRSQIPAFRLPREVLVEEVDYILDLGAVCHFDQQVDSLKALLDHQPAYDAIFIGTGAPRGRDLSLPGRDEAAANIHIGIDWLSSVAFGHTDAIGRRVIVLGGGNTAMDCCRTSIRLGGTEVKVVVRSPFDEMKASPWEKEDSMREGIPILNNHVPKEFLLEQGRLSGVRFEKVEAHYDNGKRRLIPTGEPLVDIPCDEVLIAIGQDNAFPWIERDIGLEFGDWDMPVIDKKTYGTSHQRVFIGGDAALGPENIITAVAHGHQAAISIHHLCQGKAVTERLAPGVTLFSQRMGIHEWSYDSAVEIDERYAVPHEPTERALSNPKLEVELGFDATAGYAEAQRCLNCDVQTVFAPSLCIECDACVDICPTDCITFTAIDSGEEEDQLRASNKLTAKANNKDQPLYLADQLATGRFMVKDENICLHCGLCAERCPTAAWDMQRFLYHVTQAGESEQESAQALAVDAA